MANVVAILNCLILSCVLKVACSQQIPYNYYSQPGLNQPPNLPNPPPPTNQNLPKPTEKLPLNASVLNNLAIAMQLLIVSHILNTPLERDLPKLCETLSKAPLTPTPCLDHLLKPKSSYTIEESLLTPKSLYALESQALLRPKSSYIVDSEPLLTSKSPYLINSEPISQAKSLYAVPNSKFLGTSYTEPAMFGVPRPNMRSSMTLMSPYEALGSNSAYSDSILTSSYNKKDFKNPYAAILAADNNRDVFSLADLFV